MTPGKRSHLVFENRRLTSRKLAAGSRLVLVVTVPKERDVEINYGTGADVAHETIADAKTPLQIDWYGDSFIDVPVAP